MFIHCIQKKAMLPSGLKYMNLSFKPSQVNSLFLVRGRVGFGLSVKKKNRNLYHQVYTFNGSRQSCSRRKYFFGIK